MTTMTEALTAKGAAGGMVRSARPAVAAGDRESAAKNILLFFAAPWIGLAYIIAFPFVGTAIIAKALVTRS